VTELVEVLASSVHLLHQLSRIAATRIQKVLCAEISENKLCYCHTAPFLYDKIYIHLDGILSMIARINFRKPVVYAKRKVLGDTCQGNKWHVSGEQHAQI
jgi:hypothetical protein